MRKHRGLYSLCICLIYTTDLVYWYSRLLIIIPIHLILLISNSIMFCIIIRRVQLNKCMHYFLVGTTTISIYLLYRIYVVRTITVGSSLIYWCSTELLNAFFRHQFQLGWLRYEVLWILTFFSLLYRRGDIVSATIIVGNWLKT